MIIDNTGPAFPAPVRSLRRALHGITLSELSAEAHRARAIRRAAHEVSVVRRHLQHAGATPRTGAGLRAAGRPGAAAGRHGGPDAGRRAGLLGLRARLATASRTRPGPAAAAGVGSRAAPRALPGRLPDGLPPPPDHPAQPAHPA